MSEREREREREREKGRERKGGAKVKKKKRAAKGKRFHEIQTRANRKSSGEKARQTDRQIDKRKRYS